MKKIEILAPAKINLFLKILNKRKDGFHNIETVFEKISLCDKIVVKELPRDEVILKSNSKNMSSLCSDNLVCRAASLIKKRFKIKNGLSIFLEKNIPVAAGLGGGSSDAAAVLKGLNELWKLGLHNKDLLELSKEIGSDVSLFALKESFLLGRERGDQIFKIQGTNRLKLWHILVVPDFKIQTSYAYSLFDRYYFRKNMSSKGVNSSKKLKLTIPDYSVNIIIHTLFNRDVSLLNYYSYNSFESMIIRRFTRLARLKQMLEALSSYSFYLSGSGPSLFLTLSKRKEAERLVRKIGKKLSKERCFLVHTY